MTDINLKIALAYKVPRITKFIEEDIKLIKRLQQILIRLERNYKEKYILEAVNIIRQMDNIFDMDRLYPVICDIIDVRFHSTILLLKEKMNGSEQYIKKLRELADDETE